MDGKVCTFFGHRECYGLDREILCQTIEDLIDQGVDTFYVGNQGGFDGAVYSCLKQLRKVHPHIRVSVVLAYLPTEKREGEDMSDTMYPEGLEARPAKFAIERRNRWLVNACDFVICYIHHTWGGAYKFAQLAKKCEKNVLNICTEGVRF